MNNLGMNSLVDGGRERRQREVAAQEAAVETTDLLKQIARDLDQERTARLSFEAEAARAAKKQSRKELIHFIIGTSIGLLTLISTVLIGILGLLR